VKGGILPVKESKIIVKIKTSKNRSFRFFELKLNLIHPVNLENQKNNSYISKAFLNQLQFIFFSSFLLVPPHQSYNRPSVFRSFPNGLPQQDEIGT
jgi:hypothetical protein